MPQDVFDMGVAAAVKIHILTGKPMDQICAQIVADYERSYKDDHSIGVELGAAAMKLLELIRAQFRDEQIPHAMTQMMYCIRNYEPDGKKKKRQIFGGTLFNRTHSINKNCVNDCLRNMLVFHTGTMTGRFPVAPTGWTV